MHLTEIFGWKKTHIQNVDNGDKEYHGNMVKSLTKVVDSLTEKYGELDPRVTHFRDLMWKMQDNDLAKKYDIAELSRIYDSAIYLLKQQ